MLFGRKIQSNLPTIATTGKEKARFHRREQWRRQYDEHARDLKDIHPDQSVRVQDYATKKWEPAVVKQKVSEPRLYSPAEMELSIVGIDDTSERLEKHSHVQIHITVMRIRMENTQLIEVNWLLATTLARKLNQSTSKNHQPVSTTLRTGRRLSPAAPKESVTKEAALVK
ncbi:hypothetical protein NP493_86g04018 [Ridgeia piscesae]|uniref:Uncharacterized protein n=1 Tax=Ridgeia piscesae TaxID=27915 RepID=A0AAD9P8H4_RIDPI|nr:hypothetical protein NP493_86g04018 [Ridgeia piscesae]